jgi:hypothetical protein
MHACPKCELAKELERQARLVAQEVEAARDALRFDLSLDERLELVAEEHALERLREQIERRRFALEAVV